MLPPTNLPGARDPQTPWWIARICLTRGKIEETFRFVKQSYQVENIRVVRHQRLKDLVGPVAAAAYFAAAFPGQELKLKILCEKVPIVSGRFSGIAPFRFYAPAGGIRTAVTGARPSPPAEPPPNLQLDLPLAWQSQKGRE